MAGWPPGIRLRSSERTANLVAEATAGATPMRKSVSRSVKSRPARTMPAAPQHAASARKGTRSSWFTPIGRQTSLNLMLRLRSRSGKSENLAIGCLRSASVANLCGSLAEYSASASRRSYCGATWVPVKPLTASVSGSRVVQQVMSVRTVASMSRIAAVCNSLTPSPEAASAAISRRARLARSSHTLELFHCFRRTSIPRILGSTRLGGEPSVIGMTHLVQHTAAGEGVELATGDAIVTVKIDGAHTDDHYELFEVDAPRSPTTPPHHEGWAKAFYVLNGRILVQVEDEAVDLGPGSSIAIPPGALNTFTVLTPTAKFLALSLTGGMGRFFSDLDATVPHDRPIEEAGPAFQEVLSRHDVTIPDLDMAEVEPVP
jgi:quercetin dioxygenase-like cupin family protein